MAWEARLCAAWLWEEWLWAGFMSAQRTRAAGGLRLLMANDVAPVVDFDHRDLVFLIHHRDRHW
jgi:hypothetical protein